MSAIPSAILISNLAAAQQSLDMAKQAYENWKERNEKNKEEIQQALARQMALEEEEKQRDHDIAEGTKNLHAAWIAIGQPPVALPASPPASPGPKRLTKQAKAAMSPEQKKAHKAAKKLEHDERKAQRTPEEQAKIDARVAKMQAALAASRAAKKAIQETGDEMPALISGASV
jgi:DNA repair exonuclease SbcCD ATPase subunit